MKSCFKLTHLSGFSVRKWVIQYFKILKSPTKFTLIFTAPHIHVLYLFEAVFLLTKLCKRIAG